MLAAQNRRRVDEHGVQQAEVAARKVTPATKQDSARQGWHPQQRYLPAWPWTFARRHVGDCGEEIARAASVRSHEFCPQVP